MTSLVLGFSGCASKEEIAAKRRWETQDERSDREVFHSGWLKAPMTDEDREFFYPSSARRRED